MTDRDKLSNEHKVEPEPFWQIAQSRGIGGYETMSLAATNGWSTVASWGEDGWNLGNWPYVVFFARRSENRWELAEYVEGDVRTYSFPDQASRDTVVDGLAFWYWKNAEESWVAGYDKVDQLPPRLRGPFGAERAGTPRLVRLLLIPTSKPVEVWYVRPELATLQAIVGGQLEVVRLTEDAHMFVDEEGKLKGRPVNHAATRLWHGVVSAAVGRDLVVGDAIVLGDDGADEADCPQWPIDALAYARRRAAQSE
jgi:Domain of unknown function (DUF3846)